MKEPSDELERLAELLALEKKADYEQFKEMMKALSLEERVAKGYCWYQVNIVRKGYTVGDRAYLIVERISNKELNHHFRSGNIVTFFTKRSRIHYPERMGTIDYVHKHKMRIILNTKDLPNWVQFDNFGVEMAFDARTYEEMEKALKKVTKASSNRLAELRDILLGYRKAQALPPPPDLALPQLNASQVAAVQQIIATKDISIVHGPPGTGKTTTLVHAIKELCKTESTILVTAPSNAAVDLLTERIAALELNVLRIGNISRVDESILQHTLEVRISNHIENRNIKKIRLEAVELRRKAWRIRRRYGRKERTERKQYLEEAKELSSWAKHLEDQLLDRIISSAQVITCTLVGSAHPFLAQHKFRTIVIDEAAQALETATWIPISRASKVILAGDPFQLPPTIKSIEAKKRGFDVTLIEKAIQRTNNISFLDVQYRMNEKIMQFSNQNFYKGTLKADDTVKHHTLKGDDLPLEFIDTAGCGFDEKMNEEYKSRYNPDEFQILCEHLYQLAEKLPENPDISIGIISPYRQQVIHMEDTIAEDSLLQEIPLTVNTIDGFQGQEKDVIYISLVRSNNKSEIGFLNDYRRMNVAMTRARKKLIIVGDSATIGGDEFYKRFLDYCDQIGGYRTAWEFMS
ncbi:MAG: AAA domain-containing protein [Bacteroidota bacterium]